MVVVNRAGRSGSLSGEFIASDVQPVDRPFAEHRQDELHWQDLDKHSVVKNIFRTIPGLAALVLGLVFLSTANAAGKPTRVVSINLCTDQLLLLLAEPEQIASISYLSLEPESSFMAEAASEYTSNHARIEELLTLEPNLILASEFSPKPLIKLVRRLGYPVEIVPLASNIDDIRQNIRRVAGLLGVTPRGESIIREMDRRLRQVAGKRHPTRPKALFYQPRGYTSGLDTLQDEALNLASWRNLAADQGIRGYASIGLESLILARPDRIFTSSYASGTASMAQRRLSHPVFRRLTGGKPLVNVDYRHWICGGPMIAGAVEALDAVHPNSVR